MSILTNSRLTDQQLLLNLLTTTTGPITIAFEFIFEIKVILNRQVTVWQFKGNYFPVNKQMKYKNWLLRIFLIVDTVNSVFFQYEQLFIETYIDLVC